MVGSRLSVECTNIEGVRIAKAIYNYQQFSWRSPHFPDSGHKGLSGVLRRQKAEAWVSEEGGNQGQSHSFSDTSLASSHPPTKIRRLCKGICPIMSFQYNMYRTQEWVQCHLIELRYSTPKGRRGWYSQSSTKICLFTVVRYCNVICLRTWCCIHTNSHSSKDELYQL